MDRVFITMLDLIGAERVFALDQLVQILEISQASHGPVEGWNGAGSRIVLMEGPDIFTAIKPFELWKQLKEGPATPPVADDLTTLTPKGPVDIVWDTSQAPDKMWHWLKERGFKVEATAWLDADNLVLFNCTRASQSGARLSMPLRPWMSYAKFEPDRRADLLAAADKVPRTE